MKVLVMGLVFLTCSAGVAWADCQSESAALQARAANVDSAGMGMCQAATTLAEIYQEASELLLRCPMLDMSGQDAIAYQQAADEAWASANASCG